MNKKIKPIEIAINDQKYLYKIIEEYPKIKSGRKNYYDHYFNVSNIFFRYQVRNGYFCYSNYVFVVSGS